MPKHCEALNDLRNIDFVREKNPRCPHCNAVYDIHAHEAWRLFDTDEGDHDIVCDECETPFRVAVHCDFSFSTDDQPEPEEYDV